VYFILYVLKFNAHIRYSASQSDEQGRQPQAYGKLLPAAQFDGQGRVAITPNLHHINGGRYHPCILFAFGQPSTVAAISKPHGVGISFLVLPVPLTVQHQRFRQQAAAWAVLSAVVMVSISPQRPAGLSLAAPYPLRQLRDGEFWLLFVQPGNMVFCVTKRRYSVRCIDGLCRFPELRQ
jgi:hypothetical protein